jgi:hypothetical protein
VVFGERASNHPARRKYRRTRGGRLARGKWRERQRRSPGEAELTRKSHSDSSDGLARFAYFFSMEVGNQRSPLSFFPAAKRHRDFARNQSGLRFS